MKKLCLGIVANMFRNFKGHSLEVYFKQVLWKSWNMKGSPYIISKNVSQRLFLVNPQKVALESKYVLQNRWKSQRLYDKSSF